MHFINESEFTRRSRGQNVIITKSPVHMKWYDVYKERVFREFLIKDAIKKAVDRFTNHVKAKFFERANRKPRLYCGLYVTFVGN